MSRVLLAAAACCMTGCLITADPSIEEPVNLPPSVHGRAPTPMYEVIVVNPSNPTPVPDAGAANVETQFFYTVRDANVNDRLFGRVYVNLDRDSTRPNEFLVADPEIPVDQDENPYAREGDFAVQNSDFDRDCNVVELHVSRGFAGVTSLLAADPGPYGDLGVGIWYVVVDADDGVPPSLDGCAPEDAL